MMKNNADFRHHFDTRLRGFLFHDFRPELIYVELGVPEENEHEFLNLTIHFNGSKEACRVAVNKFAPTADLINSIHQLYSDQVFLLDPADSVDVLPKSSLTSAQEPIRLPCSTDIIEFIRAVSQKREPTVVTDQFNAYCCVFSSLDFDQLALLRHMDCAILKDALVSFEKYSRLFEKEISAFSFGEILVSLERIVDSLDGDNSVTLTATDRNYLRDVCILFEKVIQMREIEYKQ